jgi:cytochrome oxidase Cu insertion factor (SCO1/SenC/PrrC family)
LKNMQRRHFLNQARAAVAVTTVGGLGSLLGSGVAWGQSGPPPSEAKAPPLPEVGTVLKLPTLTLFDGSVFIPEQVRGQVLVLYWWASTCPFCALQSPEMQKLWLSQRTKGLQMLALSVDRKKEDALPYFQKRGYTFPSGWVTPEVQAVLPKPKGLPITIVVGRQGQVLQAEKGQLFPEDVAQLTQWLG